MEGLAAAGSVIAVIQLTEEVFKACTSYVLGVKDARDDVEKICAELTSLHDVLSDLQQLEGATTTNQGSPAPGQAPSGTLWKLSQPNGPIAQCVAELATLKAKLDSAYNAKDTGMRRVGLRALKWPLSSKATTKALETIQRQRETILLALATDSA